MAILYLHGSLKDDAIVNLVHDVIVIEVGENQAETVRDILKRDMIQAGQNYIKQSLWKWILKLISYGGSKMIIQGPDARFLSYMAVIFPLAAALFVPPRLQNFLITTVTGGFKLISCLSCKSPK